MVSVILICDSQWTCEELHVVTPCLPHLDPSDMVHFETKQRLLSVAQPQFWGYYPTDYSSSRLVKHNQKYAQLYWSKIKVSSTSALFTNCGVFERWQSYSVENMVHCLISRQQRKLTHLHSKLDRRISRLCNVYCHELCCRLKSDDFYKHHNGLLRVLVLIQTISTQSCYR